MIKARGLGIDCFGKMFRLVGRLVARPSVPLYVMRGARTRRAKEDDPIAAAKAAIQPRRRGRPSSQMSEDLLERAPRRSAIPVPGALLKDKDLLEDTEVGLVSRFGLCWTDAGNRRA